MGLLGGGKFRRGCRGVEGVRVRMALRGCGEYKVEELDNKVDKCMT